ncbi:MAG: hypothetical protein Q7T03_06950, partial [Deltaproteobacteria bacterium]|nr:hypothetical protein [Deltaproteobacteria bacterium]
MKGWGLLTILALFFAACGSGQTILSDAGTTTPALNTTPDPAIASKSNDKNLEALVKQIHSPDYDNYLVVQVESAQGLDLSNGRLSVTDTHSLAGARSVNNALDKVGNGVVLLPLFTQNRWLIDNVRRQLEVLNGKKLPDLNAFLKLSILDQDKAEDALRRLWKEAGIKSTYPGVKQSRAGIDTFPDLSTSPYQSYLYGNMPGGLNIEAVWRAGVKGAGVRLSDDECDWNIDHENFNRSATMWRGSSACDSIDLAHGTAVLGILGAADRGEHGIKGIASDAELVTRSSNNFEEELNGIRDSNNPGDVYLWEAHIGSPLGYFVPMEMIPSVAAEMDIAAANGLVIIEPSGNGSHDLDDPSIYTSSEYTDLRTRRDSGIIMVGASTGGTRERLSQGNYGSRINLYSWGSGVVTTSYPNSPWVWTGPSPFVNDANQPNLFYTNGFNGTSS